MRHFISRNRKRALLLCICAALAVGVTGCGEQRGGNTTSESSGISTHAATDEDTTSESSNASTHAEMDENTTSKPKEYTIPSTPSPQDEITMWESFGTSNYTPFAEHNRLKTLDEPASLRFTIGDTLPHLNGSYGLYPAYAAIAQATYPDYLNEGVHKGTIYSFVGNNTTAGAYERLVDRECDMIFVPGPGEEQETYAKEKGVELVYTPVCREAFVFFVHPDNPIDELSQDEIRGIYSGQITDWAQAGAPELGNILAYQRNEESDSQTAMEQLVMQGTPLMTPPMEQEAFGAYDWDYINMVTDYQNLPGAIGYSFRIYCSAPINKDIHVKLLAVDGVEPTAENIENGAYPLIVTFYAVTRSDANKSTRALLDWICTEQGQALIEKAGYFKVP